MHLDKNKSWSRRRVIEWMATYWMNGYTQCSTKCAPHRKYGKIDACQLGSYLVLVHSSTSSWNGDLIEYKFGSCTTWLILSSSKHFIDHNKLNILLQRGKRNQKLNMNFSQRCSISCKGKNNKNRWLNYGHGLSPEPRPKSQFQLSFWPCQRCLSTFSWCWWDKKMEIGWQNYRATRTTEAADFMQEFEKKNFGHRDHLKSKKCI